MRRFSCCFFQQVFKFVFCFGHKNHNSFNVRYLDTEDDKVKYGLFYRGNDLRIEPLLRYDGKGFPRYNVSFSMVEF